MRAAPETGTELAVLPPPETGTKKRSTDKFSGARKAAMLLVILGEKSGAEIVRHLSEDEVQTISKEIARSSTITSQNVDDILEEFYQMTVAREYVVKGGMDYARKMLVGAFGNEPARRILDRLAQTIGEDAATFDPLQKADPQQLAKFIQNEHPQTIALILRT